MSKSVSELSASYEKMLAVIGVVPKSDGILVQNVDGVEKQIRVDGKPLALPIKSVVDNYSEDIVVFHPLSESTLLGESPVIQELRQLAMDSLNHLIATTMDSLLTMALDETIMEKLSPTQVTMMRATAGCDATTLKNWRAIMRRIEPRTPKARIITIFLKRGAELSDVKYQRVGIVNFNLYDDLLDEKTNILGVKIRKNDIKVFKSILETMFDNIDDTDHYSVGSNSSLAPYFDALLNSYHNVLKEINRVTWNLRKHIEEATGLYLHVTDEFMKPFKNLVEFRDTLPIMPYNDGDRQPRRGDDANQQPPHGQVNQQPPPQPQQQISQPYVPPPQPQQQYAPPPPPVVGNNSPYFNSSQHQQLYQPQNIEPVSTPNYNTTPGNNSPTNLPKFPSLADQLAGAPLGGTPLQYGFQPQPQFNSGGNPYIPPQMQQQQNFGFPQPQQNFGFPQPQQNFGFPQPQQNFGFPQQQQNFGFPQPQGNGLWPQMPVNWNK